MKEISKLEEENLKLKTAVAELAILNDIATAISSTQPVDKVIDQIVSKCIKHLCVEEGVINLLEDIDEDQKFHTMIRKQDISKSRLPYRLDNQLTGWMIKNQKALLVNDIREDERFHILESNEIPFSSLLSVPLMTKGKLTGLMTVFNKKGGEVFTSEDQRLLSIIAAQSAQVIENARLYEEEKDLLSMKEEMRMAKDIQLNLLPKSNPKIDGYQISAITIPAKDVGGDYYDFIQLEDERLGFCLGDITGKGMPAAMLMANLQAALRSQTLVHTDCATCLQFANKILFQSTEASKFATLFYGVLNPVDNVIDYCNGGHDSPLLFKSDDDPVGLEATGLLLGCIENTDYNRSQIIMDKGDILLVYSDGVTESMNEKDEEFGLDALISIIKNNRNENSNMILHEILNAIKSHSNNIPQSDDVTVVIIKRE